MTEDKIQEGQDDLEVEMSTEEACVRAVGQGILNSQAAIEQQIHINISRAFSSLSDMTEHVTNRSLQDLGIPMPEASQKFWDDQAERIKQIQEQQEAHAAEVISKADELLEEGSDGKAE